MYVSECTSHSYLEVDRTNILFQLTVCVFVFQSMKGDKLPEQFEELEEQQYSK